MNKQKLLLTLFAVGAVILGITGFLIGKSMSGSAPAAAAVDHSAHKAADTTWTCSMHPQIKLKKPGKCPICAMDLIPLKMGEALGDREIKLSKLAEKLADIEAMPVIRKEFYMPVQMVGKISLDETRSKKITSRFSGRLDRLFVDYTGVEVKKGAHLFEIYSPQLINAQEELLQSIESAKAMQKSTIESIRISSKKAVEASRDKLRLWGLTDEQIKKFETTKVITDHVTSYSPLEGVVIKKHVDEGSYVKEGSVIYGIANLDYLWVELDAYESDLQWLHYAQEVAFTTEAWPGEEFKGRVSFIHPILNDKTRTVKVRVNVDNKDRRLKPDMFVRAQVRINVNSAGQVIDKALSGKWISPMHPEIISDKPGPCSVCGMDLVKAEDYGFTPNNAKSESPLLVPASAPLITGKRAVVYIKSRSKEGSYQGRTITLGLKAGDYYIVKSGLKQGDLVVTRGAFKIDSALQIQAKPSMMSLTEDQEAKKLDISLDLKKALTKIYNAYDSITVSLSKDSIENLAAKLDEITAISGSIDVSGEDTKTAEFWRKQARELALAVNVLKTSKDIKTFRRNFESLSLQTIGLIKIFGTVEDFNLAYCPMALDDKGAYWLQKSPELVNPYFGSQMLHCGDIKKKFSYQLAKISLSEKNRAILESAIADYFKISELLAEDKKPTLDVLTLLSSSLQKINMKTMSEEVHLALMKEIMAVKKATESINRKSTLKDYRKSFATVSSSFISLMKLFPFIKKDSFVLNCPMAFDGKGANWLQLSKKTKNPYLGLEMQACGDVKSSFKAFIEKPIKVEKTAPEMDHSKHNQPKPEVDHSKQKQAEEKAKEEKKVEDAPKHNHSKMTPKVSAEGLAVYLALQKGLSQDRFPESGKEQILKSLKAFTPSAEITTSINTIYTSKDIKKVRSSFKVLSDFMIKLADTGSLTKDVNLSHCSMAFEGKGGSWLQASDKVENPYYGSKMYRCGDIKKKIAGGK